MISKTTGFFFRICIALVLIWQGSHDVMASGRDRASELYRVPEIRQALDFQSLSMAVEGFDRLRKRGVIGNADVLTIIEYHKPSVEKRLHVLDMKNGALLLSTLVAHGRNSGGNQATAFSNESGSYMSSAGFFVTGQTYQGKHGYSLRLKGLEEGLNSNAESRHIVMHAAEYVSHDFIRQNGRLGRSLGCPALPESRSREVIDSIKNGSCLFVYSPLVNSGIALRNGGAGTKEPSS